MGCGTSRPRHRRASFDDEATVTVTSAGFSPANIVVYARQGVHFKWPGDASHNVVQVSPSGGQWFPVPAGFHSGDVAAGGEFSCSFGAPGTFFFTSEGLQTGHVRVTVRPRPAIQVEVTDEGFVPDHLEVLRGDSVTWVWGGGSRKHELVAAGSPRTKLGSKAGSKTLVFRDVNVYRFESVGLSRGEHTCTVTIRPAPLWHRVRLQADGTLYPRLLEIQQGDVVLWSPAEELPRQQRHLQQLRSNPETRELEAEGGVESEYPLDTPMSVFIYTFSSVGYFCFTSIRGDPAEHPAGIGTVLVKPEHAQYFLNVTPSEIVPPCAVVSRGHSLTWAWLPASLADLRTSDGAVPRLYERPPLVVISRVSPATVSVAGAPDTTASLPVRGELKDSRLASPMYLCDTEGVYECYLKDFPRATRASVIVKKTPENHEMRINDKGFAPKVLIINQGDSVWFKWRDCRTAHGIVQVSLNGKALASGFASPKPLTVSGALLHTFSRSGSFYLSSPGHSSASLGMVFVLPGPELHVMETPVGAQRVLDPILISARDTVVWALPDSSDLEDSVSFLEVQADGSPFNSSAGKLEAPAANGHGGPAEGTGVHHLTFTAKKTRPADIYFPRTGCYHFLTDQDCLLTVIVDAKAAPAMPIHVSRALGFQPSDVTIRPGSNVRWYWYGEGEYHNVVQVDKTLKHEIAGGLAGGDAEENSDFLHTFELEQTCYTVSDGLGDGHSCTLRIVNDAPQVATPACSPCNGGSVQPGTPIHLECGTSGAAIHYTLNGSKPTVDPSEDGVFVYNPSQPIRISSMSPHVRAIALKRGMLMSEEFVSHRFSCVDGAPEAGSGVDTATGWQLCRPTAIVKGWPDAPHISWSPPRPDLQWLVAGHDVFVNGEKHSSNPSNQTAACCDRLSSLPPDSDVAFTVQAYATLAHLDPLESEPVVLRTPSAPTLARAGNGALPVFDVSSARVTVASIDYLGASLEWVLPEDTQAQVASGELAITSLHVLLDQADVSGPLAPTTTEFMLQRHKHRALSNGGPCRVGVGIVGQLHGQAVTVAPQPVSVALPPAPRAPVCHIEACDEQGAHLVWTLEGDGGDNSSASDHGGVAQPMHFLIHLDEDEPFVASGGSEARSLVLPASPAAKHAVAVTAVSRHGDKDGEMGVTSEPVGFTYLSPPPPPKLSLSRVVLSRSGIRLDWDPAPDGIGGVKALAYTVAVKATTPSGADISVTLGGQEAGGDALERAAALEHVPKLTASTAGVGEVRHTVLEPFIELSDCQPGAHYAIIVVVVTDTAELPLSGGSNVLKIDFVTRIRAPTDVAIARVTEAEVEVGWAYKSKPNPREFTVTVANDRGDTATATATGKKRSAVVLHAPEFALGDGLGVHVVASAKGSEDSLPSASATTTIPKAELPAPVLEISRVDEAGITVRWDVAEESATALPANAAITGFRVEANGAAHGEVLAADAREYLVAPCEPGTTYRISVSCVGTQVRVLPDGSPAPAVDLSSASNTEEWAFGPPARPEVVVEARRQGASLRLPSAGPCVAHRVRWWRAPPGTQADGDGGVAALQSKDVEQLLAEGMVLGDSQLGDSDASFEIGGLDAATQYIAVVEAVQGPLHTRSEPMLIATLGAPRAPVLSLAEQSESSITVAWEAPAQFGVDVAEYHLTVEREGGAAATAVVLPAHQLEHTIDDLPASCKVTVTCAALTADPDVGGSAPSAPLEAETCGVDAATLRLDALEPGRAVLAWDPAVCYGAYGLSGYRVDWVVEPSAAAQGAKKTTFADRSTKRPAAPQPVEMSSGPLPPDSTSYTVTQGLASGGKRCTATVVALVACNGPLPEKEVPSEPLRLSMASPPTTPVLLITRVDNEGFAAEWQPARRRREGLELAGYSILVNNRVLLDALPPDQTSAEVRWSDVAGRLGDDQSTAATVPSGVLTVRCVALARQSDARSPSQPAEVRVPDGRTPLPAVRYDGQADSADTSSAQVINDGNITANRVAPGALVLSWANAVGAAPARYAVAWSTSRDPTERRSGVEPADAADATTTVLLSPVRKSTIYFVRVLGGGGAAGGSSIQLAVVVPGPPDAPLLRDTLVEDQRFHLAWEEPQVYGVPVVGYQLYLGTSKIGGRLAASHRVATVPCKPSRSYAVGIVALGEGGQDSEVSRPLAIRTSGGNQLYVRVAETAPTTIGIAWPDGVGSGRRCSGYVVEWSSVVRPKVSTAELPARATQHTIRGCSPGHRHFVVVRALGRNGKEVTRSEQLIVQTPAPPDAPVLRVQEATETAITIAWDRPEERGSAHIDHFVITVDGREVAVESSATSYTLRDCEACMAYEFRARSVTTSKVGSSPVSDPLRVTCPGAMGPVVLRRPSAGLRSIAVAWQQPRVFGEHTIAGYEAECVAKGADGNAGAPTTTTLGPDKARCRFDGLTAGQDYAIVVGAVLSNGKVVRSAPLVAQTARRPEAPTVRAAFPLSAARQRRFTEVRDLLKDRAERQRILHRLDRQANTARVDSDLAAEDAQMVAKQLMNIEVGLAERLRHLRSELTGTTTVDISWARPWDDGDATVTGYRLCVDGEEWESFGASALDDAETCTRLELGNDQAEHTITVVATTDSPVGASPASKPIVVDTASHAPFTYRCALAVHQEGVEWPATGCCAYLDTFIHEIEEEAHDTEHPDVSLDKGKPKLRPGVAVPPLHALLVADCSRVRINQPATLIVFWSHWCKTTPRLCEFVSKFAREMRGALPIATCMGATDRDDAEAALARHWPDDLPGVTHTFCDPSNSREILIDTGITHVPELILITGKGKLSWRGFYPAVTYEDFREFLRQKALRVLGEAATPGEQRKHKRLTAKPKPLQPYGTPGSPSIKGRRRGVRT